MGIKGFIAGGGPMSLFSMASGPDPSVFKSGQTTNYAGERERSALSSYLSEQRAKGGSGSGGGWNSRAMPARTRIGAARGGGIALRGTGSLMSGSRVIGPSRPTKQHTLETYPLGAPSAAWWKKFGRWGPQGPIGNVGWATTLKQAPSPQSTTAPSQRFKKEVIQTRETRKKNWAQPFITLTRNANVPRMNPQLAHMYVTKNLELGSVRRSLTSRVF